MRTGAGSWSVWGVGLAMSTAAVLSAPPARADNDAKPTEYTVKNGDTCPSIAAASFGDVKRVDLVHVLNPQLGPVPHHLKEGQILLLPPKPTPEVAGPDAKLTRVRNAVEVRAPDPRVGKVDDPLYRGNRVGTKDASAADLTFRDETQVRLGENTLVVIFGDTNASAARANAAETTLVTGSLRARLSEIAGKKADKPRVETASGAVVMKAGEAQVSVDHQQATRLAVYQGGSTVTAQRRTVPVDDGFGSKAEMGKVPTPPRPLPAAPVWSALPSALVLTDIDTGDVTGSYAPGQGPGDPAAEWHVQLARDVDFADVVADVHVPLATVALAAQKVPPGSYAVRVSAIDADAFEGKWGSVATFAVSRVVLDPLPVRRTRVSTPDNSLACVVDGGPPLASPFEVERNAEHTLSCTSGAATSLLALPQLPIVHVSARADLLRQGVQEGTLRVRVTDAKGELLDHVEVIGQPVPGVRVGAFRRFDSEGVYIAPVSWDKGIQPVEFKVLVAGTHAAATNAVRLEPDTASDLPPREPRGIELSAGAVGAVRAFTQLGVGGFASVTVTTPVGPGVAFASLRGFAELYPRDSVDTKGSDGAIAARSASVTVLGGALPFGYRLGRPGVTYAPYLLLAPQLARQVVQESGAPTSAAAVTAGGYGALGLERRAGPGAVFLEAGFRAAVPVGTERPTVPASALLLGLGYRLGF